MNNFQRYEEILSETWHEVLKLSKVKGGEYAGDEDRLANFRRNAQFLGLPMESVWAVYAAKHWDAIGQYVKDRYAGTERPRAEPILGRVDDLIVYLLLFKLIYEETNEKPSFDMEPIVRAMTEDV